MTTYHAPKGAPIWNFAEKEIWAFWAEDRTFKTPRLALMTMGGLLGEDTSSSPRTTVIIYERNHWIAHGECIQSDFRNHPWFVMNPLQGPQAMLHGLRELLQDKEFLVFAGTEAVDALRAYEKRAETRAKTPWF